MDPSTGRTFWYNATTMESADTAPAMNAAQHKRPTYATSWSDARFPDWVQFTEFNSRRHYYLNRATGHVQWAPPGADATDDADAFPRETDRDRSRLTPVPADAPPAPLHRRLGATAVDALLSVAGGLAFAGAVWLELGRPNDALPSIPFGAWACFLLRDSVFEQGTRSPGKRLMGLEIVRWNGKLPGRRHTLTRQAYLPVYAAATVLMPYIALLPVAEAGLLLLTARSLRVGDVLALTRVIEEQPDRAARLQQKADVDAREEQRTD